MKAGKFDSISNKVYFMAYLGVSGNNAILVTTCYNVDDASKLSKLLNQTIDVYIDSVGQSIRKGAQS